jgi:hypothetical protein
LLLPSLPLPSGTDVIAASLPSLEWRIAGSEARSGHGWRANGSRRRCDLQWDVRGFRGGAMKLIDWREFECRVQKEYEKWYAAQADRIRRKFFMAAYDSKTKTLRDLITGEVYRCKGRWIKEE